MIREMIRVFLKHDHIYRIFYASKLANMQKKNKDALLDQPSASLTPI